ncbi:HYC_CC_PP family protein [Sporocytophaga myxococcoides]|uniref:HYC_CC_PP family protein n=1 Tax=Sporocytophaga myxococcoides TaxID=153721 RepID=UPI0005693E89|nr:hypothetical protein [Sporocytophaga myxococcoides]
MYFQRFINIVLVFALLISVIGVTTTSAICKYRAGNNLMCKSAEKNCCKNTKESNNCCEVKSELKKLDSDLLRQGNFDNIPDIILFAAAYFYVAFEHLQAEDSQVLFYSYSPPLITQDLSVLHQVFRI